MARIAVLALVSLAASGCRREPGTQPGAGAPDSTRTTRQRIAFLEGARSFGAGELARDLGHPDPRVRRAAVVAFGRIQDPAATRELLPLLDDPDSSVAHQAAFALGQLQGLSEEERHALQSALVSKVDNDPVAANALFVEALGKQGGPEIAGVLAQSLATGVLAASGSDARDPFLEGVAATGLGRLHTAEARALLAQVDDLRTRRAGAAWRIAASMAADPDTSFYRSLASLLDHQEPFARAAGARALGKSKDPRALRPLLDHLSDLDWEVRASILIALGELSGRIAPNREVLEFCASLSSDAQPLVREAAIAALDSFHVGKQSTILQQRLGDPIPAVRLSALLALARSQRGGALAAWEAARQDSVEFVRCEALGATRWVRADKKAIETLAEALRSPLVRERCEAASALADPALARGARRAGVRASLETALQDADFVVAALAAEGLGKLKLTESARALAAAYDAHQRSRTDAEVRLAALNAAAELARETRRRGGEALASLASRAAHDPDPRVANAAALVTARLAGRPDPTPVPRPARDIPARADSLPVIDLGRVSVRLVTAHGDAILELDGDRFPRTVGNFLRLVDAGSYDRGVFHRVVPSFVVQGGCPREYGDLRYDAGVVGMAHAGKDTGGSQFFITHVPVPRLDGRYTAFGRVMRGMDVVDRIVRGDWFRVERVATPAQ
jgi:cyclophilin family peptidyl-prolyl cis-trans isomerase/HEAT repeat protein